MPTPVRTTTNQAHARKLTLLSVCIRTEETHTHKLQCAIAVICNRTKTTTHTQTTNRAIYLSLTLQDYYNVLIFFDVVALFVTFSRLLSMHLALQYIDQYKARVYIIFTYVCVCV